MNKAINKLKKYFPVIKRVGNRLFLYRGKSYVVVRESYTGKDIFIDYYRIDPEVLSKEFKTLSKLYAEVEKAREEMRSAEESKKKLLESISTFRNEESRDFVSKVCGRKIIGSINNINGIYFIYKFNACYVGGVKMSIFDIISKSEQIKSLFRHLNFKRNSVKTRYAEFICHVSIFFNKA